MSEDSLTRSKGQPASISSYVFEEIDLPGGQTGTWNGYAIAPSYDELFEIRSPDDPGSHKTWKSWEHYKCSADSSSGPSSALITVPPIYSNYKAARTRFTAPYSLYNGVFGAPGRLDDGLPAFYIPTSAVQGFIQAPSGLSELVSASLRTMLPLIRPELSLVNSAIELKDFKTLKGTIRNILKLPKLALRRGRKFKNVWNMLQVAADVYLQWKFNISPLISDVHSIYRALANTERRLNGLISRAGKLQVAHFTRNIDEFTNSDEEVSGPWACGTFRHEGGGDLSSYATATHRRLVHYDASVFHAQLQYNYHYTDYQLEHARVLALLDSLGVNLNPAIVWNAIPWSFVVDWLVDVGRWLNTQRIGNMDPKINIMQYLWSIRRSRRIYVSSKITTGIYYPGSGLTGTYPPEGITLPVVSQTAYRRSAGLPSASSLTTSGLNSTEFSLGAALVISRRRHRPKHH